MPKIRTSRTRKPPSGFEDLEPQLKEFEDELKEIQLTKLKKSVNKNEPLWEIFKIYHKRSRYIYDLYYNRQIISRELYLWLLKEKFADLHLIAKWKKKGYENLCCLRCIMSNDNNNGFTCICRVPKANLTDDKNSTKCVNCGCRGCASSD
ncbi:U2 snRNP complex subunit BUD31 [Ascoidea rubescens DSM 1968]|uniref:G10 protein n=1 Tax=Ascoidea rubescens DSM 1968 TaxID=1344418 RepID=A0A1D2VI40_9ASCO|nr:G10 protein [Ascoidea rubescens DSM 1968]ODV61275.1 G10 protein [Ascoidea rubescens DSM 1968]